MSRRHEEALVKLSLFVNLKRCCERILSYPSSSIWSIYGGIGEFVKLVDEIFQHRVKTKDLDPGEPYSPFLSCLGWLRPVLASDVKTLLKTDEGLFTTMKNVDFMHSSCNSQIIKGCLQMGALYDCVYQLVQDHNIITLHYDSNAFLNDALFTTGLILCIKTVEQKSSCFLSQFSLKLLDVGIARSRFTEYDRVHSLGCHEVLNTKYCNDYVANSFAPLKPSTHPLEKRFTNVPETKIKRNTSKTTFKNQCNEESLQTLEVKSINAMSENSLGLNAILPDVVACTANANNFTVESIGEIPKTVNAYHTVDAYNSTTRKTYSDPINENFVGPTMTHRRAASDMALAEARRMQTAINSSKLYKQTNASSLMHYLHQEDLSTCEDLKKENAHFHLSEILITVMEEKKCKLQPDLLETRLFNQLRPCEPTGNSLRNEVKRNHGTLEDETAISLKREPDPNVHNPALQNDQESMLLLPAESTSAETIAIGLLKTFSNQDTTVTPNTETLDWLVSENDVPQSLLPIPNSTVIDPEFTEHKLPIADAEQKRLRGNENWAPLRFQLIFNIQKNQRSQTIANQKYMCAGCGAHVERAFIKRFRFCEYTGKYFCSCCHDNAKCVIPAHIFTNFNFKKYEVSNFSHDLLQRIHDSPLFNIDDINSSLYFKSKSLNACLKLRGQASHLTKYLEMCRNFVKTQDDNNVSNDESEEFHSLKTILAMLNELPLHILKGNVHVYSIQDLMSVKNGNLLNRLKNFIEISSIHVDSCNFCLAKGFICEICGDANRILFPHQIKQCHQCHVCKSCYHLKCFSRVPTCPKCERRAKWNQINNVPEKGDIGLKD